MKREYINQEEYADLPTIYGKHAPYWCSLSFTKKLATIRRVGLFGFLREAIGLADSARIRERLELEHDTLTRNYEGARERIEKLEQEKRELEQKLNETTNRLEESERNNGWKSRRLLTPPSAKDIMAAFNKMCPNDDEKWFFIPYEDPDTGVVSLSHNCIFYPFGHISIPRGKLRLCDQYGWPVCLMQCYSYSDLPSRYAQHLIPSDFRPYRMRVLFVTKSRDLWLAEPRSAQDVILEIRASYEEDDQKSRCGDESYEMEIKH